MLSIVLAVAGPLAVAGLVAAARRATAVERTRALGRGRQWRLPTRLRGVLARALADADLTLEPEAAVELWAGTTAAAGLVAAALSPGLVPPAVLLAIVGAPAGLWVLRARAHKRYAAALPLALEQIAAHLRGGGTVGHGVAALADGDGVLAADLRRVQARADLGVGLADALAAWPAERDVGDVRAVAGALGGRRDAGRTQRARARRSRRVPP